MNNLPDVRITTKELQLKAVFTTSFGSSSARTNVFYEIEHDGIVGRGLAAPHPRYDESPESTVAALEQLSALLTGADLLAYDPLIRSSHALMPGAFAAKAAFDMAVLDWVTKYHGMPLYRLWGGALADLPPIARTVSIDTPEAMAAEAQSFGEIPFLKIKLDGVAIRERISAVIASYGDGSRPRMMIDANEGWYDREQACA